MHFSWKKKRIPGLTWSPKFSGPYKPHWKIQAWIFQVLSRCCTLLLYSAFKHMTCLIPYIEKIRTAVNIFLDDHNLLVLMKKNQRLFISNCIIHCGISFTKYSHTVSPVICITVRNNTSLKPRNVFPAGCPSNALRMTLSHEIQLQS